METIVMDFICSSDDLPPQKINLPTQDIFGFAHATEFLFFLAICAHQGAKFVFYCVHSREQNFQRIFFKLTPYIHYTTIETLIYFHH